MTDRLTIAVIGGGSAAEALVRELAGRHDIVIFEPKLVGGECPFVACMPSKSMLHDRLLRDWPAAVERREEIVSGRDDSDHAESNRDLGATIVRARATITGRNTVEANGTEYRVDHIVVATGAEATFPDVDGLDSEHDRVWTSEDALTAFEQPASIVVLGGGVIGSELAFMFSGFGTASTTLDLSDRPANDLHPRVSEIIATSLGEAGVNISRMQLDLVPERSESAMLVNVQPAPEEPVMEQLRGLSHVISAQLVDLGP